MELPECSIHFNDLLSYVIYKKIIISNILPQLSTIIIDIDT